MSKLLSQSIFSFSNSGDTTEKNDIQTTINENTNLLQNLDENSSIHPDFQIFPLNLKFQPCFPNSRQHKSVILTNSGNETETFLLSIKGNSFFSIKKTSITAAVGQSASFYVYYSPLEEGSHHATLEIIGKSTFQIPVSAKCVSTTIDVPKQNDQCWTFVLPNKIVTQVPIVNRDFSKSYNVSIKTNCEAIILGRNNVNIEPASSFSLPVTYDTKKPLPKRPQIAVQCEELNIRLIRDFAVTSSKSSVILDFGTVAVNTQNSKTLTIENNPKMLSEPNSPFAYSLSDKTLYFTFHPSNIGVFSEIAKLDCLDIILEGESVLPPFIFDIETKRIINTSDDTIKVLLKPLTKGFSIDNNVIEIEPKQSAELQFSRSGIMVEEPIFEAVCGKLRVKFTISEDCFYEYDQREQKRKSLEIELKTPRKSILINSEERNISSGTNSKSRITSFSNSPRNSPFSSPFVKQSKRKSNIRESQQIEKEYYTDTPKSQKYIINSNNSPKQEQKIPKSERKVKQNNNQIFVEQYSQKTNKDKRKKHDTVNSSTQYEEKIPKQKEFHQEIQSEQRMEVDSATENSYDDIFSTIAIEPKFLLFANVSQEKPSQKTVKISCTEELFNVEGPKWLKLPESVESDVPFPVISTVLPSSECASHLTVSISEEQNFFMPEGYEIQQKEQSIPIIAYKGTSKVECNSKNIILKYKGKKQYSGDIEITNSGDRSAFIVLTTPNENVNISVLPSDIAIIKPGETKKLTFVVFSSQKQQQKINLNETLLLYTGDEIMRQIRSFLDPQDSLSLMFNSIEAQSEITNIISYISELDLKQFAKVFKKSLKTIELTISTQVYDIKKPVNTSQIAISPSSVSFQSLNSPFQLSLMNMSSEDIGFDIQKEQSSFDYLIISPTTGIVPKYSEIPVTVSILHNKNLKSSIQSALDNLQNEFSAFDNSLFSSKFNQSFQIITDDGVINVPVTFSPQIVQHRMKNKIFSVKLSIIDFGICPINTQKEISFPITNLTQKQIEVFITRSDIKHSTGFYFPATRVELKPLGLAEVLFTFSPKYDMQYEEEIILETVNQSITMKLIGKGMNSPKKDKLISCSKKKVDFSICEVCEDNTKSIKIMNKTDKKKKFTAKLVPNSDIFTINVQEFSIDPHSFIKLYINFKSKTEGFFASSLEIHSEKRREMSIPVKGRAIVAEI